MGRVFYLPKLSLKLCHFDRREKPCLVIAIITFLLLLISNSALAAVTGAVLTEIEKKELDDKVISIQVPFIENQGQIKDERVKYYAKTLGGTVFITQDGQMVYSLPKFDSNETNKEKPKGWVIKESLEGASISQVKGEEGAITKVSYFKGEDPSEWRRNLSTYNLVSLGEVYKGIELKLKAYGNNVEKLFYLKPNANPEDIKVTMEGAKGLKVNEKGELEVETGMGVVKFTRPVAYQTIGRTGLAPVIQYIEIAYLVKGDEYSFKVGDYDWTKELVIDPLLASTFLGGSGYDSSSSITIDSSGNVYVAGYTLSSDFPTTTGAYDRTFNGSGNTFVSKFDANLQNLLASTFLGGSSNDYANSITIDSSGNVYVAGGAGLSGFPTTTGAYDRTYNGGMDAFVSKLDADLQNLLASTFLGGGGHDVASSISIDSSGNVYVAGWTESLGFPTTTGAYDSTFNGGIQDVFVSKFDANLQNLLASTFLGSSSDDVAFSISIDSSGNVYVAGGAGLSDFPTTTGAYDRTFNGSENAFVSKFDANLQNLLASTFLGGSSSGQASSIAIDSSGNVYVAGRTYSSDFPTTTGAYDRTYNGGMDAFVSKLDANLKNLLASTFLGGSNDDQAYIISIDNSGNVYVAGTTSSSNFPTTTGAYDTTHNGDVDVFVSRLDGNLSAEDEAPTAPTGLSGKVSKDTISLSWQANTESDLAGYKLYYDTDKSGSPYNGTGAKEGDSPIDVGNVISYSLTGLADGLYYLVITAYDKAGNESNYSQEIQIRVDTTSPTGLIAINDGAESTTSLSVTLTLSATDAGSGTGEGAQMRFSNGNQTWSDPEAYSTTKNNWDLTAYGGTSTEGSKTVYALFSDAAGNWMSRAVSDSIRYISEADTTAPSSSITAPSDGATVSGKVYTIKGTASDDKSGVDLVEVSTDDGTSWQKATGTINWQYDWTLPADGTYTIKARATDKKGNIETPGNGITVIVDNQGISTPTGLTATGGAKSVNLSWNPNKESDLAGYNIYREIDPTGNYTTRINQELIKTTSYTDTQVEQGKTYWYKITAVDIAGNESNKSAAVSAKVGAITVWMPDIKGEAGDKVTLPINVSNATGVGSTAGGIDIKLSYNPNLLTPTKVSKTSLTKDFTLYDNVSAASGQLNISGINTKAETITGEGSLVEVEFSVNRAAVEGNTATLSFVEVKLYDEAAKPLTVDYTDTATFTVGTTYKRGDLNGDGAVDSADALIAMKIATGELEPSKEQQEAGDINGNGKINTADAILILRMAVGLPIHPSSSVASTVMKALGISASSHTVNVSIGDHAGEAGSTITVPIIIDNLAGIAGADILLTYDPDILTATGTSTTSLSTGFNLQYRISSGAIAISILSTTELSGGSGAFVNVSLQVNSGAKTGSTTSFTLAQASLYDQYGQELSWNHTVKTTKGKLTIAKFSPSAPTGLKATVEGKTVYIQWQANSESNLDHYNLYVGTSSKGYSVSGSPFNVGKVTSLTASDVPEGTYYLALSAVNSAGLESSLSEEIKVVVGGKPSITISSNKNSYSPGDTFILSFSLSNSTATTQIVDVFLGIVAPDGSIYFFDYSSFIPKLVPARVDDSRTFTAASTSLELSPGYDSPLTPFFSMTLPTGLPEGTYQAFAALAETGSVRTGSPRIVGDISISSFTYSP